MIQKLWGYKVLKMVDLTLNFHNFCCIIKTMETKIYLESAWLELLKIYIHLYSIMWANVISKFKKSKKYHNFRTTLCLNQKYVKLDNNVLFPNKMTPNGVYKPLPDSFIFGQITTCNLLKSTYGHINLRLYRKNPYTRFLEYLPILNYPV